MTDGDIKENGDGRLTCNYRTFEALCQPDSSTGPIIDFERDSDGTFSAASLEADDQEQAEARYSGRLDSL